MVSVLHRPATWERGRHRVPAPRRPAPWERAGQPWPAPPRPPGRAAARVRPLLLPAAAALLAYVAFLLVRGALVDDAYITLTYVRNLAFHGHWGANLDGISHTATSPLNVLVQAAVTVVVRDAVLAAGIVLAGLAALVTVWSRGVADELGWPRWTAALPVPLLVTNPLLLSTVGLETYLAITLLVGLAYAAVARRVVLGGVLCGLLALTRPDLVVVAAVAALAVPAFRRRLLTTVAAALAVSLPWYLVSWVVLGSIVPDTVLWKVGSSWGHTTFTNGLETYDRVFPTATTLALLTAAAGILGGLGWLLARRPGGAAVTVLGAGAVAHVVAFAALGTAPFHWYYGPAIGALTVLAAWSAGALGGAVVRAVVAGALAVLVIAGASFDLDHGTPWTVSPIESNWATPAQYAYIASYLQGKVGSAGELGTLAYFCGDRCAIDDSLSERAPMLARIAKQRAAAGPVEAALLDVNYRWLQPAPYVHATTKLVMRKGWHPDGVNVGTPWSGRKNVILVPVNPSR
ncbi:hypothetical protein [Pseudonocardia phyllosphaerae]|uniref:hypothetical protein n=1 Tax=Pseudonocardia phyllosphaerae TaxID=3390502 RepID=UPI00397E1B95